MKRRSDSDGFSLLVNDRYLSKCSAIEIDKICIFVYSEMLSEGVEGHVIEKS